MKDIQGQMRHSRIGTTMDIYITATILTSVVVAAVVSALFGLLGQYFERKARQKELVFMKSVELAKANRDYILQVGKDTGRSVKIHDYAPYAEMYYWLLMELEREGRLPKNWRNDIQVKFPELG